MMKPMSMETSEERAAHQRIRAAIGGLDAGAQPRADWQARVMASVRAEAAGSSAKLAVATAAAVSASQKTSVAAAGMSAVVSVVSADAEATVAVAPSSIPSQLPSQIPSPIAASAAPRAQAAKQPRAPWWTRFLPMARPLALACAAAAIVVVVTRGNSPVAPPVLTVELAATRVDVAAGDLRAEGDSPATTFRGDAPTVGSQVRLTAASSAELRALWVFFGRDELVLQCPGAGCTEDHARLGASLQVARIGEYTVVAIGSDEPLPKPPASLDEALALLKRSGAAHRTHRFTVW